MKKKGILSLLLAAFVLLGGFRFAFVATAQSPDGTVKNVILMIGDGMGENHLALAEEQGYELFMTAECDLRGQSKTRSASHIVTDSAAGGTALACGVRIINQTVGVYAFDPFELFARPRSITEAALANGMKAGVVTTDKNTGATPASFSVHALYRKQEEKISRRQLLSGLDLIWGAADGYVTAESAAENGWSLVTTAEEMRSLTPGTRSFGQFGGDMWRAPMPEDSVSPSLAQMTEKAISLLDAGGEGFFLMVEGAHIDKESHKSDHGNDYPEKISNAAMAVKGFDDAIKAAVEFARADGETIVLVTADHETGNLYFDRGRYTYHSHEHTAKNVPVLVFGCDDLFSPGEAVENRSIPVRLAAKLGWDESEFPKRDPGFFPRVIARMADAQDNVC